MGQDLIKTHHYLEGGLWKEVLQLGSSQLTRMDARSHLLTSSRHSNYEPVEDSVETTCIKILVASRRVTGFNPRTPRED